jgi:hypothetical protein
MTATGPGVQKTKWRPTPAALFYALGPVSLTAITSPDQPQPLWDR